MKLIRLTHANLNQTIYVVSELIAGFYHSPANNCTHVCATGGTIFPAKESVAEISRLLTGVADATPSQEEKNGT